MATPQLLSTAPATRVEHTPESDTTVESPRSGLLYRALQSSGLLLERPAVVGRLGVYTLSARLQETDCDVENVEPPLKKPKLSMTGATKKAPKYSRNSQACLTCRSAKRRVGLKSPRFIRDTSLMIQCTGMKVGGSCDRCLRKGSECRFESIGASQATVQGASEGS